MAMWRRPTRCWAICTTRRTKPASSPIRSPLRSSSSRAEGLELALGGARAKPMTKKPNIEDWNRLAATESKGRHVTRDTPEHIRLKNVYSSEDAAGIDSGLPGLPPYTRGPYATMYAGRPWTIRQYAGFSTAEECNALYRL